MQYLHKFIVNGDLQQLIIPIIELFASIIVITCVL